LRGKKRVEDEEKRTKEEQIWREKERD